MVRLRNVIHLLEIGGLLIAITLVGTVGFVLLEGHSWEDAVHLTLQTITTVGYGSPEINTPAGRMFSNVLMVFGVGAVLYGFWLLMDLSVGDHIRGALGLRTYRKELKRMEDHVIVAGLGRVGEAAVERLRDMGQDIVVICREPEAAKELPEKLPRVIGDATNEEVLRKARLERAEALLIAFGDDSDTILAIVTARSMRPDLRIIARASFRENTRKMVKVGANEVIVPELEGGRRMADHSLPPRREAAAGAPLRG